MTKVEKIEKNFGRRICRRQGKAVKAREAAQKFVFSPMLFHAVSVAKGMGLLANLADAGKAGLTFSQLLNHGSLDEYGLRIILDGAISASVINADNGHYSLSDMGYFIVNDPMTEINYNFVRDVCYKAMPYLHESLMQSKPVGLETLGDWSDVYQGLSSLPNEARKSWFEFDHYYSDNMFAHAVDIVFDRPVYALLDVGANTGKWARQCLRHDSKVEVTLVDLPSQLEVAKSALVMPDDLSRIFFYAVNVLKDDVVFSTKFDVIWMSQFLDCFGEADIVSILQKFSEYLAEKGRLIVVELFADRQSYDAAALSLNATSLYFCCIANGKSRFYQYDEFCDLLRNAGFDINETIDFASGHSALICTRRF